MATVHANQILTIFMLLMGGHYHYVKVSSDSETVRGMGLWEFSGALRELMLNVKKQSKTNKQANIYTGWVVTWILLGYTVRMFKYTVRTF